MTTTEYVRDLGYTGVGEVCGELGDCCQHLLRCYGGVGGVEIYNKGENSEQEVASHDRGKGRRGQRKLFRGLLKCLGRGLADQTDRDGNAWHMPWYLDTMRALCLLGNVKVELGVSGTSCRVPEASGARGSNAFVGQASLGYH